MKFGRTTGLIDYAKANGYVLALPQGVENSWNPGMTTPQGFSALNDIDDLGFIDAMLNDLATSGEIDSSRIYGTGVSEGGTRRAGAGCTTKNLPHRRQPARASRQEGHCVAVG
jgi:polyhydroxybutyrate depolymerase